MYTQNWPFSEKEIIHIKVQRQYAMVPLCLPHHLSHNSETTNHATAKGELIMFESPILYILVITRKKKRTVCVCWGIGGRSSSTGDPQNLVPQSSTYKQRGHTYSPGPSPTPSD